MAGPVDIDPAKPHAFLSYTRFDDDYLKGGISVLREELERAVRARTGEPFNIFQDVEDIKLGDAWRKKLDRAIEAAQFFIPILTPNFFTSEFCRGEAEAFLDYEARAGRDDLVLPIYLIDTPKLDDAEQRADDDLASRLHERQYDDWRKLRFKLRHDETRPRVDELAGAIASAIARNGKAATPPHEPTLPDDVIDRLTALEGRLEERDQVIAAEQSRRERAESALSKEKAKSRELAEAPAAFEGKAEEARKREATLRKEIESLKARFTERDDTFVKQRLAEAEAALEEERAKREPIKGDASGVPRSFYLGAAALALLVGAGGWMAGEGGSSSSDIDQLRRQNRELIEQLEARKVELGNAEAAMAGLQASSAEAEASSEKVAELTEQVEALTARLAASEQATAMKERELLEAKEALAQAQVAAAGKDKPLSAGETFRDCANCPEMVVIPAGSFEMGSPADEEGREDDEGPQHPVTIGATFALGKYEVTRDQFSRFVSATGHEAKGCNHYERDNWKSDSDPDWRDPGYEQTGAHPVTCVNWQDAQTYIDWLSRETDETYRLPSEAEWEYAARAGTTTRYYWGDDTKFACTSANGHDETGNKLKFTWTALPCDDGYAQTAPVGSFRANAFGLHDVSGNVWEWVEDFWDYNYDDAPTDGSAWLQGNYSYRVIRGGSWINRPEDLRSAVRSGPPHLNNRHYGVGFRLARTLTP